MSESNIIPIYRAGNVVSSLGNSFGGSLRETRLTAMLGYLLSLSPEPFMPLFGIKEIPHEINLEFTEDDGRTDIQLFTSRDTVVIEAKISMTDPLKQAQRYRATKRVLITNYIKIGHKPYRNTYYVTWQKIADVCAGLINSRYYKVKFLADDLTNYLKEYNMIEKESMVEIYAREVNEETTLSLFLHGQIYSCIYEQGSRIPEANYFAPHFGRRIANLHPGISVGISYVARILSVDPVNSAKEAERVIIKRRGKVWLNSHRELLRSFMRQKFEKNMMRYLLLLGEPRLIFNPPVKKELLQKGSGWLSKRYLTFDELFKAWSGKSLY